jgi:hypothetical protein
MIRQNVGAEAPTLRPPKDSSNQNEYADVGGLFDQRVRGTVGKMRAALLGMTNLALVVFGGVADVKVLL